MTSSQNESNRALVFLIAVFALLIAVFHFGSTLAGYPDFRDMHLGAALEYAKGRIDLFKPIVVGFNANGTPTVQELPLWQAATAIVFKVTHSTWFGWANMVSLLLFGTCLWPLYHLARVWLDCRGAWWVLVFFLAQPLIIVMAGRGGTDGFCLALMIWFLYFVENLVRTAEVKWWLPSVLFACLAAISKLPFFMAAGWCAVFLLFDAERLRSVRRWLLLASVGLVAVVVFLAWTRYTMYTASIAEFPYVELGVGKTPEYNQHFFGDWAYRLNPYNWGKGGWRVLNCTLGSFAMVALALGGWFVKASRFARLLLLGCVLTTLVFTHLVLVHYHYYLMVCPAVACLCGGAFRRLELAMPAAWTQSVWVPVGAGVALALAAVQGLIGMKIVLQYDRYPSKTYSMISRYTQSNDKLVVLGGDWGGRELFCTGRNGLSVQVPETLAGMCIGTNLARLQQLGFNRLVMISESPLLAALQEINPGSRYQRKKYPASVSPTVDSWPILFQDEDIIFKQIPVGAKDKVASKP